MLSYVERSATEHDSDFIYKLSETTMRRYVEATWGVWDDDWQLARFTGYYQPERWRIIKVDSINGGAYETVLRENELFLARLYVLPEYQNKGIGSSIVKTLLARSKELGIPLTLDVLKSNTDAQRLYTRLNLRVIDENEDRVYMSSN